MSLELGKPLIPIDSVSLIGNAYQFNRIKQFTFSGNSCYNYYPN
jgi:hypothetical protein